MPASFSSSRDAKAAGWFSRRNQSGEASDEARRLWQERWVRAHVGLPQEHVHYERSFLGRLDSPMSASDGEHVMKMAVALKRGITPEMRPHIRNRRRPDGTFDVYLRWSPAEAKKAA